MTLEHDFPDCTGRWTVRTVAGRPFWKCSECRAIASATMRNHEAAVLENLAGDRVDQLTQEEQNLLDTP